MGASARELCEVLGRAGVRDAVLKAGTVPADRREDCVPAGRTGGSSGSTAAHSSSSTRCLLMPSPGHVPGQYC